MLSQTSLRNEGTLDVTPLHGARAGLQQWRGRGRFPRHKLCIPRATVPRFSNQFGPRARTGFVLPLEDLAGLHLPRKLPARAAGPACSLMGAEHPSILFCLILGVCAIVPG